MPRSVGERPRKRPPRNDCGDHGELWGTMGNYGELWGIMGNYGELWGSCALWGAFGDEGPDDVRVRRKVSTALPKAQRVGAKASKAFNLKDSVHGG